MRSLLSWRTFGAFNIFIIRSADSKTAARCQKGRRFWAIRRGEPS